MKDKEKKRFEDIAAKVSSDIFLKIVKLCRLSKIKMYFHLHLYIT